MLNPGRNGWREGGSAGGERSQGRGEEQAGTPEVEDEPLAGALIWGIRLA